MDFEFVDKRSGGTEIYAAAYGHWYDHNDDMTKLSKLFPDALFELYGDGENSEDFWRYYYYRGAMQGGEGTIIYPPLDFDSLQNDAHDMDEEENGPSGFAGGDLNALMASARNTE